MLPPRSPPQQSPSSPSASQQALQLAHQTPPCTARPTPPLCRPPASVTATVRPALTCTRSKLKSDCKGTPSAPPRTFASAVHAGGSRTAATSINLRRAAVISYKKKKRVINRILPGTRVPVVRILRTMSPIYIIIIRILSAGARSSQRQSAPVDMGHRRGSGVRACSRLSRSGRAVPCSAHCVECWPTSSCALQRTESCMLHQLGRLGDRDVICVQSEHARPVPRGRGRRDLSP